MDTSFYTIKHKTENMYVHFNPKTKAYIVGGSLLGACLFNKQKALEFILMAGLGLEWEIVPASM